jgi:hypothetical protein
MRKGIEHGCWKKKNLRARTEGRYLERPATCTVQHTKHDCCSRLQQVRTRCQRVDVCAPRRFQRADLNCFPAEEMVRLDNPTLRPTSLMVVWPRSSLALYLRSATQARSTRPKRSLTALTMVVSLANKNGEIALTAKKGAGWRSHNETPTNATHPKPATMTHERSACKGSERTSSSYTCPTRACTFRSPRRGLSTRP